LVDILAGLISLILDVIIVYGRSLVFIFLVEAKFHTTSQWIIIVCGRSLVFVFVVEAKFHTTWQWINP